MTDLDSRLRRVLADVLPPSTAALVARLRPDDPLRSVGLDSLRLMELISAIEDHFDIRIDDDDLRDEYFASLTGLARLMAAKGRQ